jgi:hypothetical protein
LGGHLRGVELVGELADLAGEAGEGADRSGRRELLSQLGGVRRRSCGELGRVKAGEGPAVDVGGVELVSEAREFSRFIGPLPVSPTAVEGCRPTSARSRKS